MVDRLTSDHDQIMDLCGRLRSAVADNTATITAVADVLIATVSRHLSAEEQYLYPTVRAALPDGGPLVDHELTEDAAMLQSLKSLHQLTTDHPALPGLVETVTRQLSRHRRGANDDLFPRLREHCSHNELVRLGSRVEIAAEAAPARPHPGSPLTPPVNKVVDPAISVVDK